MDDSDQLDASSSSSSTSSPPSQLLSPSQTATATTTAAIEIPRRNNMAQPHHQHQHGESEGTSSSSSTADIDNRPFTPCSPQSFTPSSPLTQFPSFVDTTPLPPLSESNDANQPKLKGKARLLQGFRKVVSTTSSPRAGRSRASSYNGLGRSAFSISCVSFGNPTAYLDRADFSEQVVPVLNTSASGRCSPMPGSSAAFSTAPTSQAATPVPMSAADKFRSKLLVPVEFGRLSRTTPTTPLALPSSDARLEAPDYFSSQHNLSSLPSRPKTPIKPAFEMFSSLPYELRLKTLSFLSATEIVRCSIVSKAWHRMCFDGQLWTSLDASEYYRRIPPSSLTKIITSAGPFVRDLNLRGCIQDKDNYTSTSESITDVCKNLEHFTLEGCKIDRTSVHFFLIRNPRLLSLNLSGLSCVNDTTMQVIAKSCPRLERLDVSWCRKITSEGLIAVAKSCTRLKNLKISHIANTGGKDLTKEFFALNTLETIDLSYCDDIDDAALTTLLAGPDPKFDILTSAPLAPKRRLSQIHLSGCGELTSSSVSLIGHACPNLTHLRLSGCKLLTDSALHSTVTLCPSLTFLDLEELTLLSNSTLTTLSTSPCINTLQHLSISYCESLSDIGMLPVLKSATNLKNLELDNTRISDLSLHEAAIQISMRNRATLTPNASGKPEVRLRIVCYDCANVTWTGIRAVLKVNAEFIHRPVLATGPSEVEASGDATAPQAPSYPSAVISLKVYHALQPTVSAHLSRVLKGELVRANILEGKWAEYMLSMEEAEIEGTGARRRRRRARRAARVVQGEDGVGVAGLLGVVASGTGNGNGDAGRRRARSGGCVLM